MFLYRKLETCVELLTSLIILGNNLKLVSNWLKDDNLFPQDITPEEYSQNIRLINNRAFFGNHIAFQVILYYLICFQFT